VIHLDLPRVSPWVAAALLNTRVPQAEDVLEQLFDAQPIDIAVTRLATAVVVSLSFRCRSPDNAETIMTTVV
jgi:hypothetical protein